MSPKLKKFAVLALVALVGAAGQSGFLPEGLASFLTLHMEALVLGAVGLILPELGKK
jgi:hypothetical protein